MSTKRSRTESVLSSTTHKKIRIYLSDENIPLPYALCALNLIASTPSSIQEALDTSLRIANRDTSLRITNTTGNVETKENVVVPSLHGERGSWWHMYVVRHAMYTGPTYLKDLKFPTGGCIDLHDTSKSFLVEGHLNARYMKKGPGRHMTEQYHAYLGSARHFIAVRNGRVHSIWLPKKGIQLGNLWLDDTGRPDPTKGFMKRLLKVYEVVACR
jgi:hypothetical protein